MRTGWVGGGGFWVRWSDVVPGHGAVLLGRGSWF